MKTNKSNTKQKRPPIEFHENYVKHFRNELFTFKLWCFDHSFNMYMHIENRNSNVKITTWININMSVMNFIIVKLI